MFIKDPKCVGFIYKCDLYCVTVEKFHRSVYGGTLRIVPSQKIGLIMKISPKYTYAALLHKGTFIKPGDLVCLDKVTLELKNPFKGIMGRAGYSNIVKRIPAYNWRV